MKLLNKYPYLSNFYPCSFIFAEKEWGSVDEVFKTHKNHTHGPLSRYKDTETILSMSSFCKFAQNKDIRQKLLLTDDKIFDNIGGNLGQRLRLIKEVLQEI